MSTAVGLVVLRADWIGVPRVYVFQQLPDLLLDTSSGHAQVLAILDVSFNHRF